MDKNCFNCLKLTLYLLLFVFWWTCSMLISQVFFRGRFNDGAVGTVGFFVMILAGYALSKYTHKVSGRTKTRPLKKKPKRRRRKRSDSEEDEDEEYERRSRRRRRRRIVSEEEEEEEEEAVNETKED